MVASPTPRVMAFLICRRVEHHAHRVHTLVEVADGFVSDAFPATLRCAAFVKFEGIGGAINLQLRVEDLTHGGAQDMPLPLTVEQISEGRATLIMDMELTILRPVEYGFSVLTEGVPLISTRFSVTGRDRVN